MIRPALGGYVTKNSEKNPSACPAVLAAARRSARPASAKPANPAPERGKPQPGRSKRGHPHNKRGHPHNSACSRNPHKERVGTRGFCSDLHPPSVNECSILGGVWQAHIGIDPAGPSQQAHNPHDPPWGARLNRGFPGRWQFHGWPLSPAARPTGVPKLELGNQGKPSRLIAIRYSSFVRHSTFAIPPAHPSCFSDCLTSRPQFFWKKSRGIRGAIAWISSPSSPARSRIDFPALVSAMILAW